MPAVYTFGLDGPREFIRTIYHEVEIHESGAFREVSVKPILVLSPLASLNPPPSLSALRAMTSPKAVGPCDSAGLFP